MRYNFDEFIDRRGTNCLKHDDLCNFFGVNDVLPMWVADTDFRIPEFITDAIAERAKHPVLGYTFRDKRFCTSVMQWLERRGEWTVESDSIEFAPGVVAGIAFSLNVLSHVGDGVLIQPPVYPPFVDVIKRNNRRLVVNPLKLVGERYEIDFEDFENKLEEVGVFILCNPHNPAGRCYTKKELTRMAELCVKHDVYIVSDEIHADIVMQPHRHIHIASLSRDIANRTVTLIAPSKTFNLAGLTTSVAIIPNKKIRKAYLSELNRYHVDSGNIFGIEALIAGYTLGDEWVDQLNSYLRANMDYVIEYCRDNMPKVKVVNPEATFLMWLDFRELGVAENDIAMSLLKDGKIALNKGSDYGDVGYGFMRLNIGTTLDIVKKAMKCIQVTYDVYDKK